MSNQKRRISLLSLVMITVVSVDSIRNLPAAAKFGEVLIPFYILGAMFFLIPTALISAELAATFPTSGGIYTWVKAAYGERMALMAIWLQWIENVIWYPTILSFVVGALAYAISPTSLENPYAIASAIVGVFWLLTFINLRGIESSAWFSNFCSVAGLIVPMLLIIYLGIVWIWSGKPLAMQLSFSSLVPDINDTQMWVSLTAIMLSFSGVEIATVHANDVENPQRIFPAALAYASLIILSTLILGSLSIALVIPESKINLITGILQAFEIFFSAYGLHWCLPFIALTLAIGAAGGVSNWIIAPTKGLYFAAADGNLPAIYARQNRYDAPVTLLVAQAIIVTIIASIFVLIPDVNQSYWLLTVIATQLYMLMYLIMFFAYLRIKKQKKRTGYFTVPGGRIGAYCVAILGMIGCSVTFYVSFIPPESIFTGQSTWYSIILAVVLVLLACPPILCFRSARRQDSHCGTVSTH